MIDILLKYILWYEFFNDLDAKSYFDKSFATKKTVQVEPFLSKVCCSILVKRLATRNVHFAVKIAVLRACWMNIWLVKKFQVRRNIFHSKTKSFLMARLRLAIALGKMIPGSWMHLENFYCFMSRMFKLPDENMFSTEKVICWFLTNKVPFCQKSKK